MKKDTTSVPKLSSMIFGTNEPSSVLTSAMRIRVNDRISNWQVVDTGALHTSMYPALWDNPWTLYSGPLTFSLV